MTFETAPATVVIAADCPVSAPTPPPMVAVIVVESVAWLLGRKDVVVVPVAPVKPELGETVAVKVAAGGVVTVKVNGTPACPVVSLAVIVIGLPPAVKDVALAVATTDVPVATSYATHVGPGYDAGLEPPSMRVVVNVPVGGAAVDGESVEAVMVPSVTVSEKPGGRLPVKVSAAAVATDSALK